MVLFGTPGCHLCDVAEALIYELLPELSVPVSLTLRDIVEVDEWMTAYATRIPVLQYGNLELDWPFNREQVRDLLSAGR